MAESANRDVPALAVKGLRVGYPFAQGWFWAVNGLDFEVGRGETLGVVGESGSGKSVSMLALLGLLPGSVPWHVQGRAEFEGRNLLSLKGPELRLLRGSKIGMIFQNPGSSLNPVMTVGHQLEEAIRVHNVSASRREIRDRALSLLERAGIPQPIRRARQFPHEFSGGMAQRVMIAIAIANSPDVLIADEPTTALDVTIQAQIIDLLQTTLQESNTSLILITHNMGLIAEVADRVVVMYAGRAMESAPVESIFRRSRHPYTQGLLRSMPQVDDDGGRLQQIPGQPPDRSDQVMGCPFAPRCGLRRGRGICEIDIPPLSSTDEVDHSSACHFSAELAPDAVALGKHPDVVRRS